MTRILTLALPAAAAALLSACTMPPAAAPAAPFAPMAIQRCEQLAGMAIPAARIGLPTRGAVVATAERAPEVAPYRDAEGEHLLPTPARCMVQGRIELVDPGATPIQFAVNLPLANWNGRALQSGGGGMGGSVNTAPGNKASGRFDPNPVNVPYPITQGYVTFGSDQGHPRLSPTSFGFTRNDEVMRNWAYEEIKKTKDTAMAIVEAAYGRRPTHVFFSGESAGGREALRAAQKFPEDYDGVIATSPVTSWYPINLANNELRTALVDGFLDAKAIKLVADRTRASCDAADGLRDGVIAKYLECPNDVAQLQCKPGDAPGTCLTPAQVASVNALREPRRLPLTFAHGVTTFPGIAVTGDEDGTGWQWAFYPVGTEAPSRPLPPGLGFEQRRGALLNFSAFVLRHTIVQKDDFDPYGFDMRPHAQRIQYLSNLFDASDPDLSAFAARRGKLIIVHPSADNVCPLAMSAEYFSSVRQKLGDDATDRFMRLYVPAGGSHNVGGAGQVNALAMLEDWVLKSQVPPDAPVAENRSIEDGRLLNSMPACRFPAWPRYNGSGDPKLAASFDCVPRPQLLRMRQQ